MFKKKTKNKERINRIHQRPDQEIKKKTIQQYKDNRNN